MNIIKVKPMAMVVIVIMKIGNDFILLILN